MKQEHFRFVVNLAGPEFPRVVYWISMKLEEISTTTPLLQTVNMQEREVDVQEIMSKCVSVRLSPRNGVLSAVGHKSARLTEAYLSLACSRSALVKLNFMVWLFFL